MSDPVETAGGCSCGAVRVKARGAPLRVGICHCMDCRKHHGAVFYAAAVFAKENVDVTGGAKGYKGRHFCPECGSSVFAVSGGEVEVHLGILDAPNVFVPTYESWVIQRENWLHENSEMAQFSKGRAEE